MRHTHKVCTETDLLSPGFSSLVLTPSWGMILHYYHHHHSLGAFRDVCRQLETYGTQVITVYRSVPSSYNTQDSSPQLVIMWPRMFTELSIGTSALNRWSQVLSRGRLSHPYGLFTPSLTSMSKESDHGHLPCEFRFKYTQTGPERDKNSRCSKEKTKEKAVS